jgi:hypothetical protein
LYSDGSSGAGALCLDGGTVQAAGVSNDIVCGPGEGGSVSGIEKEGYCREGELAVGRGVADRAQAAVGAGHDECWGLALRFVVERVALAEEAIGALGVLCAAASLERVVLGTGGEDADTVLERVAKVAGVVGSTLGTAPEHAVWTLDGVGDAEGPLERVASWAGVVWCLGGFTGSSGWAEGLCICANCSVPGGALGTDVIRSHAFVSTPL